MSWRVVAFTAAAALLAPLSVPAQQPPSQEVMAAWLGFTPKLDGDLREWGREGWVQIPVRPAVKAKDRVDLGLDPGRRATTDFLHVEMKAGLREDRIYVAVRWPDPEANEIFRPWVLRGGNYVEGGQRDDAFALRLPMQGEFDRTMLSAKSYTVDVWHWTAGRSNLAGFAEDMHHAITTRYTQYASEYLVKGVGTVYIKKTRDAGTPLYRNLRPKPSDRAARLPSIEISKTATGSIADVAAKGVWKSGFWHLELARKLDTGNADDTLLRPGDGTRFQIAVFNRSADEDKSVSDILRLELPPRP